jgi:hypothetical protein
MPVDTALLKQTDAGGTHSRERRNKEVKSALYAAIGFAAISSIALAEDLSSATAPFASRDIHDVSAL